MRTLPFIAVAVLICAVPGCTPERCNTETAPVIRLRHAPGEKLERSGDEIVVCGQFFHTGTPVVTWMDPGGYDAYRVEARFAPFDKAAWPECCKENPELKTPNRYGLRKDALTPEQIERVRGGGWDLPLLQSVVDQFVFHYDMSGTSKRCFTTLHDRRCLSVHFMIDLDGTIYQTLDLKERAWHATTSNTRSIGVEISNVGAFSKDEHDPFEKWYGHDESGRTRIILPAEIGDGGEHTADFIGRPSREEAVSGVIQGRELRQYDFTPQQYDALIKLTATVCTIFPKLKCDFPHDETGKLIPQKLPDEQLNAYQGLIGHYHIQTNKVDPGPALQWERVVNGARELMKGVSAPP